MTEKAENKIDHFLKLMVEQDGSDLHFLAKNPPRTRRYGSLMPLENKVLEPQLVEDAVIEMMNQRSLTEFQENNQADTV